MSYEEKIKNIRVVEASTKGYMGQSGKLLSICRIIGRPTHRQYEDDSNGAMGSRYVDLTGFEEEVEEEGLPVMHGSSSLVGYIFQGQSRGMPIEIKYTEETNKITVYFKHILVYEEEENDLLCYVPSEEWEKRIERLYEECTPVLEEEKKTKKKEVKIMQEQVKMGLLERLKKTWGF